LSRMSKHFGVSKDRCSNVRSHERGLGGRITPSGSQWLLKAGAKGWKSAGYSNRSASVGFTAEARWAGTSAAPNVAEHKIKVAMAIVAGSVGLMS
jgi:hypothetical protein